MWLKIFKLNYGQHFVEHLGWAFDAEIWFHFNPSFGQAF